MPVAIGATVSHYRVSAKIGEGGMGAVYLAEDTRLRRRVALKFLASDALGTLEERARLVREAQAAAALDHPSICTVYEVDESAGQTFIVMAFVPGESLSARIARGPLDPVDAVTIGRQIAEGLANAHAAGVIHRDVKPGNVMLTPQGQVKITDFGLATLSGTERLTRSGATLGTAAYMSPEQAQGEPVDARTDIWSLGVVLFEMITASLPFLAETEPALLYAICHRQPRAVASLCSGVPQALAAIVERCLEKDPGRRFASMAEVAEALRRLERPWDENTLRVARPRPWAGWRLGRPPRARLDARAAGVLPGDRTQPVLRRRALPLIAVALATAALATIAVLWLQGTWPTTASLPERKHLAVLAFANVGGDAENQAFCDGLVETLSSRLTQLEEESGSLWVVPASEVRRSGVAATRDAQQAFGIQLAITGSVQREAQRVRLTLNLVQAKTQRQLRSRVIDSALSDVSALQDRVVLEVAGMLDVAIPPDRALIVSAGGTTVPQAYELYLSGRGHLQRYERHESVDRAIDDLSAAIAADGDYALAHAALGEAYWRKYDLTKDAGWVSQATAACGRALDLSPELAAVHLTLGVIRAGTGHPEQAVVDLQRALEVEPLNGDALRELAGAYEMQGHLAQAEETYRRALTLRPDCWSVYNNLGRFYFRQGRYADAEAQFTQVLALTPDNAQGYSSLGGVYVLQGRWRQAHEMFARSLEIKPTYFAYANLGTLYFQEERFLDAARMFERAVAFEDQADHRTWGNLGGSYYRLGEHEKSQASYRRAAEIAEGQHGVNPRNAELLCLLAGYYEMLADTLRARPLLEEAVRLAPDDVEVLFQAGHTYEKLGARELALNCVGAALERGYPLEKIERAQGLEALRADPRFAELRRRLQQGG